MAVTFIPPGKRGLANDNFPPWQDDVTLPGNWGNGQFTPGAGAPGILAQPGVPPQMPPPANDNAPSQFVADPPRPRLFAPGDVPPRPSAPLSAEDDIALGRANGGNSSVDMDFGGGGGGGGNGPAIVRSLLSRLAPWLKLGGVAGGALTSYFGSTGPAETGEFHPRKRFDPATSGFKPGTTFYDPLSGKPTGLPNQPAHPSSAPYPLPYESGFPYPVPDAGIGQGPFAGRPDVVGGGIGQGPFAGRPSETLRNGPGDRPSGVRPTYAPAVPPPRPKDAVAAQKPDLGYYNTQTNIDPLGRGGRRWGGPLDAPQGTAFDFSKLFQRPAQ